MIAGRAKSMGIIKQNTMNSARLPDFRNLGIALRVLVLVNLLGLFAALVGSTDLSDVLPIFARWCTFILPVLMLSLLTLAGLHRALARLPWRYGVGCIVLVTTAAGLLVHVLASEALGISGLGSAARTSSIVLLFTLAVLGYLHLRQRSLAPALTEARLQALQARIRPHFLFNSINAVLSIVRSDPRQAENALMDMADLFRVLMADNRELTSLAEELALCRQYLALEKLRLEDRLNLDWQIDTMPPDAMIPPLILQPLLENAVYHGIEPLEGGGVIRIEINSTRKELHIRLSNPYQAGVAHHQGNRMAVNNIRERLQLHFDAEASLEIRQTAGEYQVHITLPYRQGAQS